MHRHEMSENSNNNCRVFVSLRRRRRQRQLKTNGGGTDNVVRYNCCQSMIATLLFVSTILQVLIGLEDGTVWAFTSPSCVRRTTIPQRTQIVTERVKEVRNVVVALSVVVATDNDVTQQEQVTNENDNNDTSNTNQDLNVVGTIQILMSDTGGGHRASANALRDAFDTLYPHRIHCDIVDIYTEYGSVWPYTDYVSIYKYMASHPWMWKLLYEFGCSDFGLWFNQVMLELFCTDSFTKCLTRPQPLMTTTISTNHRRRADVIISVHPLTQDLPLKILAQLDRESSDSSSSHSNGPQQQQSRTTPFCTVVTDLGSAHPTWFNPSVDKCFVPSDALYQAARQRQLQPHQIIQYGLPIRSGFWSQSSSSSSNSSAIAPDNNHNHKVEFQRSLRVKLGLEPNIPIVLVVGGGDGMGGIIDISKQLGYELSRSVSGSNNNMNQAQMVVICGKNQYAKEQLEQITDWGGSHCKVHVKGFVDNMDEYMKASDVLVTKAGPGTIAEASICGLPCMMFSYLPGQEEGNIPYVENAGFGTYSDDPVVIATTIQKWISNPKELQQLQQAAYAVSRPNATLDIANDIAGMLFEHILKRKEQ